MKNWIVKFSAEGKSFACREKLLGDLFFAITICDRNDDNRIYT